ncbi:DedA family protein [Candidatus Pacearchaeota archaeon]|nr:DedA family protein [Candidatus Pacearchaeota archaeon]
MVVELIDFILHLDKYLELVISTYPLLSYLFLFLIVFFETGVVVTPFLPGDSLLFVVGALSAVGSLNLFFIFISLFFAAVMGDTVNYHLGKYFGPKVFRAQSSYFFNKKYLLRAQSFYNKYGNKTIVLARFVPIIRTFAPFVAGIGNMKYRNFILYNLIGAFLWCGIFIFGGYFFGNLQIVQDNFGSLILIIIFLSLLPLIFEFVKYILSKKV